MTISLEHQPDGDRLRDYALGLLPAQDAQFLARHLADCDRCRQALRAERAVAPLVRQTVMRATTPDSRRLAALRPRVERRVRPLQRSLALVGVLLLLLVGGLSLPRPGPTQAIWQAPVTAVVTPTLTQTATQTQTRTPFAPATATQVAAFTPVRTPLAPAALPGN